MQATATIQTTPKLIKSQKTTTDLGAGWRLHSSWDIYRKTWQMLEE